MKKISWHVRKRWMVIFYTITILAVIFCIAFRSYYSNKKSMTDEIEVTQNAMLVQLSQNLELRLNYIDKFLTSVCERPEIEDYFENPDASWRAGELKKDIDTLCTSDSAVESVYMLSQVKQTVLANDGTYPKDGFYDIKWEDYTPELLKKRVVWTKTRQVKNPDSANPATEVFSMLRTYPLITTADGIKGNIAVNISSDLLNQIVAESLQPANSIYMILDMSGNVLSKSSNYFSYNESEILENLENVKEGQMVKLGGKMYFIKKTTFSAADWQIVSVVPCGTMFERIRGLRNTSLYIALAVSVFMILTIVFSNKWMNAPVEKFMEMIVRNVEKDDNYKINNFEELGNMFVYMVTQHKELQKQLDINIPFIKYQLISKIISTPAITYADISGQLSMIKAQLYPANYIVMLSDLDNKDIIDMKAPSEEGDVYISSLYNKLEELVNQENKGFSTQLPNKMCLTLLSFDEDDAQHNTIKALEIAELASSFMKDYYNVSITTAIGDYYTDFAEIQTSYEEAVQLIKYKSIMGNGGIITTDDIKLAEVADNNKNNAVMDKLIRAFESGSREQTFELLAELFAAMKEERLPSDSIIQVAMQLVRRCMEYYSREGFEIVNEHYRNIEISLNQLETADEIKNFIGHIIDEMIAEISEKKLVKNSDDMVLKIVEYVNETYFEYNMSLNLLADKFGLSVPYLSKIFKSYTGKTFTEYLIEQRIKKAAELLQNSNKKVNEIANEVGYPNPSSFIRIFKKYYYMTPVDYRNRHRIKE